MAIKKTIFISPKLYLKITSLIFLMVSSLPTGSFLLIYGLLEVKAAEISTPAYFSYTYVSNSPLPINPQLESSQLLAQQNSEASLDAAVLATNIPCSPYFPRLTGQPYVENETSPIPSTPPGNEGVRRELVSERGYQGITDEFCMPPFNVFFTNSQIRIINCPSGMYDDVLQECLSSSGIDEEENLGEEEDCPIGNPVNPHTGNKYQVEEDYIGTGNFALEFRRYYNSSESVSSTNIGQHWRHSYNKSISETNGIAKVTRSDGKVLEYTDTNGSWNADPNIVEVLEELVDTQNQRTGWRLMTIIDIIEEYDASGKLITLTNRNDLTQSLTYDLALIDGGDGDNSTLDRITGPFGRTLTLAYDANGRIATLTNPADDIYTYSYDSNANLELVSYPDETPVNNNDNPARIYHYEDTNFDHALTGITDETGNRFANWGYDTEGRAIFSEHSGGVERIDFIYNSDGTTLVTDSLGNTQTYNTELLFGKARTGQIDGGPCSVCGNQNQSKTFDANGFVSSRTDFNGNQTTYINDTRGLETSRTEAVGTPEERTITTTWDTTFRVPLTITEPGKVTTFTYDTNGSLLTRTETDTVTLDTQTTTNTYNTLGLIATIDGPRTDVSDVTTFDYDAQGNLIKTTNALGHETNITSHDAHGRPLTIEGANSTTTTLTYDARGRLLTRTVDSQTTTFEYDGVGNIIKTTLPNGSFLMNEYDAAQRLIAVEDNLGNRIDYTLDSLGNRTKEDVKDPNDVLTRTLSRTYNSLNRLIETIGGANQSTTFGYDDNGNQTSITVDPTGLNQQTIQAFDALNRLSSTTDAKNGITTYTYDARDNLTSVTDAEGLTTTYTYDGLDNLTQQQSPDTGITTFTYDDAGNRLTQTDARGITSTYSYDVLNRLLNITYPEPSPGVPNPQNVSYTYDNATGCTNSIGRLCEMTDESGTTVYSYDARGNLISQTTTIDSITTTTSYAYNGADQLIQTTYPSGRTVDYTRNVLGQIDSVSTTHNSMTETLTNGLTYQPFGPMLAMNYGNGLSHTRSYDLDYRLTNLTTSNNIQGLSYLFDNANNITDILNLQDTNRDQTLGYDELNRLLDANGVYGDVDYGYDAIGNRLSETIDTHPETYTYDTVSHHLLQTVNGGTRNFSHDANGNTTSNSDRDFIYGENNRLKETQLLGATLATYTYNGRGERVKKVDSSTTYYHYDQSGLLLAELDDTGTTTVEYVYIDGQPLALLTTSTGGGTNNDPTEQTIDNGDAGFSVTGTWPNSTSVSGYEGSDYQHHVANGPSPDAVVIDNSDTAFSVTGTWVNSTSVSGYEGSDYQHHFANGPSPDAVVIDNSDGAFSVTGTWVNSTSVSGYDGADYQHHFANGPSPDAIQVDNEDAGFSVIGTWNTSTSTSGYIGNHYQPNAVGTGQDVATWTITIPSAGDYEVFARWTSHSNRASNAKYVITHSDGIGGTTTTTVTANQQTNGGQDNSLGTYSFDAGTATITLSDDADGYVIADAVTLLPPNAQANTATWTLNIPTTGDYEVYAKWTSHGNRASNAPYTIHHANGSDTVNANQQTNGGQFNLLGTYTFNAGTTHSIELTDQADGYVIADSLQIVPTGAAPNTATWALTIPTTGDYDVYAKWTANANRASNAPYTINHANGSDTVLANQQSDGGQFNLIGTYTFNAGATHTIELTDQADGYVIADSIQLVPTGASPSTATWQPALTQAAEYEVFAKWTANPNRASNAGYTINHTGGSITVQVNQQSNGGAFNSLGTFTLDENSTISLTDVADGYVIADAIKIVRTSTPPPPSTMAGTFFYHADHLGTPQTLTDDTQTVVWQADINPFGQAVMTTETITNNLRFPGQYFDSETNLHYNRYRYYDPSLGRYITSDPIGLEGGNNTYGYVDANPIRYYDESGLARRGGTPYARGRVGNPFGSPVLRNETTTRNYVRQKIERHHSDPKFLGGEPYQQLTSLLRYQHRQLHRDLNNFLRMQTNELGQHMRPQRGNSGQTIRNNFTRQQRLDALRKFYQRYEREYPQAARDFFKQHPGLRFCD